MWTGRGGTKECVVLIHLPSVLRLLSQATHKQRQLRIIDPRWVPLDPSQTSSVESGGGFSGSFMESALIIGYVLQPVFPMVDVVCVPVAETVKHEQKNRKSMTFFFFGGGE